MTDLPSALSPFIHPSSHPSTHPAICPSTEVCVLSTYYMPSPVYQVLGHSGEQDGGSPCPFTTQFLGLADGLRMEGGTGRCHVSCRLWLKHGVQFREVAGCGEVTV